MEIKEQVCALEQARRLKELGVNNNYPTFIIGPHAGVSFNGNKYFGGGSVGASFPAYTVAELGELLPNNCYSCFSIRYSDGWEACYTDNIPAIHLSGHKTEAESRAALLIHLLENNLLIPSEINNKIE